MNYLRLDQAAECLGVSVATVRRRIADGLLPAYRDGSRIVRVREVDIHRYMAERLTSSQAALAQSVPTAGRQLPPGTRLWNLP